MAAGSSEEGDLTQAGVTCRRSIRSIKSTSLRVHFDSPQSARVGAMWGTNMGKSPEAYEYISLFHAR